jgi:hypothetical protein
MQIINNFCTLKRIRLICSLSSILPTPVLKHHLRLLLQKLPLMKLLRHPLPVSTSSVDFTEGVTSRNFNLRTLITVYLH